MLLSFIQFAAVTNENHFFFTLSLSLDLFGFAIHTKHKIDEISPTITIHNDTVSFNEVTTTTTTAANLAHHLFVVSSSTLWILNRPMWHKKMYNFMLKVSISYVSNIFASDYGSCPYHLPILACTCTHWLQRSDRKNHLPFCPFRLSCYHIFVATFLFVSALKRN